MNHAIILPILVVIVGYGMVGPSPALAGLLALLALLPHIMRKRIVARPFIHIITPLLLFLGCAVTLGTLLSDNVDSPTQIRAYWAAFAGASLLANSAGDGESAWRQATSQVQAHMGIQPQAQAPPHQPRRPRRASRAAAALAARRQRQRLTARCRSAHRARSASASL